MVVSEGGARGELEMRPRFNAARQLRAGSGCLQFVNVNCFFVAFRAIRLSIVVYK